MKYIDTNPPLSDDRLQNVAALVLLQLVSELGLRHVAAVARAWGHELAPGELNIVTDLIHTGDVTIDWDVPRGGVIPRHDFLTLLRERGMR